MYTCSYIYIYTHIPDTEVVRLLHESLEHSLSDNPTPGQSCRKRCLAGQLSADKTALNLAPCMGVSELKRSLALIVHTMEPCIGFRGLGT